MKPETSEKPAMFCRTKPCNDCPYRTDAPLQKWSIEEFQKLAKMDQDYMGAFYGCHKNDGHVCVGWLIDQDRRNFPSIMLRLKLTAQKVTREYLDKLTSPAPLYKSILQMCRANYRKHF